MANQILLLEIQLHDSEKQKMNNWCSLETNFLTLASQFCNDLNWLQLVEELGLADPNSPAQFGSDNKATESCPKHTSHLPAKSER